ncbi:hypothetical protein C8K18_102380 [Paraburkholderia sp. GV068]|jgi:hypothetical protein|uniref:hypothetical protein n=1 Tax=Paraburkholderia TaxID=1822464 RepID=UPI000D2F870A|nr:MULTISPECIES: hypothetical protein [Paraburkholderia]AXF11906.1 hypothetical protein CUJ91_29295 [Paraburkholderia graminis]MDR6471037.1 hypothetical protein [Paraburkholderia graminis]PTR03271.1 hypothetical protein C8K19_102380 [Paraburkholderia sp. GV072]PUB07973.1 hypothetical protein C8K18_102380 [Paraburkholderia sp. GV068]
MTNTGKTLIIGLVLADLVICAYLLYPREEKKSAAAPEAALTAPEITDSRPAETHVIAGSIARPASPETSAKANSNAPGGTKVSRVDVRPSPAPTPTVAPQPALPAAPALQGVPNTSVANVPAADMQTQAQLPQVQQPTQPIQQQPVQAQQPVQTQQQVQPPQQGQQPQHANNTRSKTAQRAAEDSRGHDDLRRRGSSDVGALMTELLVRESAKLDPSLPPPPPTAPVELNRRSSNPVADAMTDQLVKESARVAPASGAQKQPGTQ